ncbi:hypothetical protein [Pseudomonas sp. R5(2019)]|uniref:hypothetical protein n=1 Tax=Pseudomonas sp. R5(2019) TaxID=2697566 RepID=UPI0014132054|nr:hypothetical protein [Pseudomonas sp. R5(2019)]NBA93452.1 hypothetical protein [Pseudomonas sp. R5(2019)]
MPLTSKFALQALQAFLFVVLAMVLGGCAITIERPANNATATSPARAVVTGNASFTGLRVTVNGTDFSSQMVASGSRRAQGDLSLPLGLHTITASARVSCWYCPGGSTQSSNTTSFVVVSGNTRVCARSGGVPVITIDPNWATVGQQPGRKMFGYELKNGNILLIIVDDAPGLLRTQMLVEVDLDPFNGVTKSKMIEAWGFCQTGSMVNAVTAGMAGGVGVGVVCSPLTPANNFRSGCTTPTPPMLINQATTSELWLRKQGTFRNWDYAEAIDQSIWQVFGGRRLRFIWVSGG